MPLDSYEQNLLDVVEESNDFVSVPVSEDRMAMLKSSAKHKIELMETKK